MRLLAILILALGLMALPHTADAATQDDVHATPSGQAVPRFVSLKFDVANGRSGPSRNHPIAWRYVRAGLPMEVVAETPDWRRVRDPDGDEVWMQARMLSATRTVLVVRDVELKRRPSGDAASKARVKQGVIAELGDCEGDWCEIEIDRQSGWVAKSELWGTELATGKL